YDQGWMCVQVFFVRQGKLIERDVSIFPFYKDSKETFISFIGQFYLKEDNLKPKQILLPVGSEVELVKELLEVDVYTPLRGKKLNIETPHHIEAFDNSNIQGADPVSAMVTFIDGRAQKNSYRKYKIQTVDGPDDYETMREVVRRRYSRVLKENLPLPDLIIV